jgi:hypothetical protein
MNRERILGGVFLLVLFGLIPALIIGAFAVLFWIAFWSEWHWALRVIAGVAGFPLFSIIINTIRAWSRR